MAALELDSGCDAGTEGAGRASWYRKTAEEARVANRRYAFLAANGGGEVVKRVPESESVSGSGHKGVNSEHGPRVEVQEGNKVDSVVLDGEEVISPLKEFVTSPHISIAQVSHSGSREFSSGPRRRE